MQLMSCGWIEEGMGFPFFLKRQKWIRIFDFIFITVDW